jgi:endonuclease/exonuclease/phosphatase family metal-dependent hydrolase
MLRRTILVAALMMIASAPARTASETFTVMQWNIHLSGLGTDGLQAPARQVHWIAAENPDVVSLNEVRGEQAEEYRWRLESATRTRWYVYFEAAQDDGIGNAILTRHKILSRSKHAMQTNGEYSRGAVEATIDMNGTPVHFFSVHLDNSKPDIRAKQVLELTDFVASIPGPRVLAGDMNAVPTAPELQPLLATVSDTWPEAVSHEQAAAYPDNPAGIDTHTMGRRRIDYIMHSQDVSTVRAEIPDQRDLTNKHVSVQNRTTDDLGVRPSDHNFMTAVLSVEMNAASARVAAQHPARTP